ncbi:MAG: galactokinase family protein, partial [Actinobacteria bacterium]|nr:galactokinase family protein [Actinomycetota bacterium]
MALCNISPGSREQPEQDERRNVNRAGPPAAGSASAAWFARWYGREPDGIWFAPGRVNLIGGPDYNEVFVLPFALGTGVRAAACRRPDKRLALMSRRAGCEPVLLSIDSLEP